MNILKIKKDKLANILQIENYFLARSGELKELSTNGTAWIFLCGSAMIEYLTKLVNGSNTSRTDYIRFVRDWMARVNPVYSSFRYSSGMTDLPEQMYFLLRCGVVHAFSMIPDSVSQGNGARSRSICFCHKYEAEANGYIHLQAYSAGPISDSVLFVAESFANDLENLVKEIFSEAQSNSLLERNILNWVARQPPISGGL